MKIQIWVTLLGAGLFLASAAGCSKNKQDCEADTPASLTYTAYIQPLVQTKCLGCHSASSIQPTLETYPQLMVIVNDGRLVNVISGAPGYVRMPYQSDPLADCDIAYIKKWVDMGAPE